MASLFGREVTDAWAAAFRLPNTIRRLFGEGSLASGFIPFFTALCHQDPTGARSQRLNNAVYSLVLVGLGMLCMGAILFMEPLLRLFLDPVFASDPERWILTVKMAQIMFGFVFFIIGYAYFSALLQSLQEFFWPAVAPAIFNGVLLIFIFLPPSWFGFSGEQLAWGVLVGGLIQMSVLVPELKKQNWFPRFCLPKEALADFQQLWRQLLPGILGMAALQGIGLVNLHYASKLGEGVISAFYWADRLFELPLSLVAVSLSTVLLPQLAKHRAAGEYGPTQELLRQKILINGFWMVPAALGLIVMAEPIVEVLFLRGEFQRQDVTRTSWILQIYAGSLLALSMIRILSVVLFVHQRTGWLALLALGAVALHALLAFVLFPYFGLQGVLFATLISAWAHLLFLLMAIRRFSRLHLGWPVLKKHGLFTLFSLSLFLCPWGYAELQRMGLPSWLALGICIALAAAVYSATAKKYAGKDISFFKA